MSKIVVDKELRGRPKGKAFNMDGLEGLSSDNVDVIDINSDEDIPAIACVKKRGVVATASPAVFTKLDKKYLAKKFKKKETNISDETVDMINAACNDPQFMPGEFLESILTYQNVMKETGASMKEYVRALKFCSIYEINGGNARDAFIRGRADDAFIKKHQYDKPGTSGYLMIAQAAVRYRKTPLIQKIMTQAQMPLYLMFQGLRYKAVEVLANEMVEAAYAKDRINAADKLLAHVKPPENMKVELDIGIHESSAIQQLNEQLAEIAAKQKLHMVAGSANLDDFGALKVKEDEDVIDAEV